MTPIVFSELKVNSGEFSREYLERFGLAHAIWAENGGLEDVNRDSDANVIRVIPKFHDHDNRFSIKLLQHHHSIALLILKAPVTPITLMIQGLFRGAPTSEFRPHTASVSSKESN